MANETYDAEYVVKEVEDFLTSKWRESLQKKEEEEYSLELGILNSEITTYMRIMVKTVKLGNLDKIINEQPDTDTEEDKETRRINVIAPSIIPINPEHTIYTFSRSVKPDQTKYEVSMDHYSPNWDASTKFTCTSSKEDDKTIVSEEGLSLSFDLKETMPQLYKIVIDKCVGETDKEYFLVYQWDSHSQKYVWLLNEINPDKNSEVVNISGRLRSNIVDMLAKETARNLKLITHPKKSLGVKIIGLIQ